MFVTGRSKGSTRSHDFATVAYDADSGSERWVARYNGPGDGQDTATALGVSPDGSEVFVTGSSDGKTSSEDYATVAYDVSAGAERWVTRYDGPGNLFDLAAALGVSPDGIGGVRDGVQLRCHEQRGLRDRGLQRHLILRPC